jgi:predicted short-subunit dehydrogenase-like oxidoreductase (DUF2520 family)
MERNFFMGSEYACNDTQKVKANFNLCTFEKNYIGMRVNTVRKICMIGAGNMATNLAFALYQKDFRILQVYNRTKKHGLDLARMTGAKYISDLKRLSVDADLYIISVSDDALKEVVDKIGSMNKLLVHTSGSVEMNALSHKSANVGVIYSPQTFTRSQPVSFRGLPVLIEANSRENELQLKKVALKLTGKVFYADSHKRKVIHMAAVFAGNFPNLMYAIAEDILEKEGFDLEILLPIIRQTASNASTKNPFQFQTGPAIREDKEILKEHLGLLNEFPEYKNLYEMVSGLIIHYKKAKG